MKKNNKRTKKGAIIALCMAGAIAISGAFAFLSDSESAINRFSFTDEDGEQTVDVEIQEPSWNEEDGQDILPLDTVNKDPQVVNKGENDVYAFVTVLVPTAKSIKLNRDDGTLYTAENVELFSYKVNDGWVEVDKTAKDTAGQFVTTNGEVVTSNAALGLDGRKIVVVRDTAITNIAELDEDANVYYTAHTYAYTDVDDTTTMQKVGSGVTTPSVFDTVTMINIADNKIAKTAAEIKATITLGEGTSWDDSNENEIAITNAEGTRKVLYTLNDGYFCNAEGVAQTKTVSQLVKDDNINIYVDTYAIQADNLSSAEVNAVWDICVNTTAGNATADSGSFDYFRTIKDDMGAKSAVKGA